MEYIAVITTVDSRDTAEHICRTLVEQRLVACAQISVIDSFYQWNGAIQYDNEFRLLCKTTRTRYADVEAAIKALHPYQLPAIIALPFSHIEPAFAQWLQQQTQPE
jgi:periplasmic divalent cation tolerance protein